MRPCLVRMRVLVSHLNAVFAPQLFCVERRAVDGVVGEFAGGRQQRRRLAEQSVVVRLQPNRLDQHRVAGVLVRLQHCRETSEDSNNIVLVRVRT